MEPNLGKAARWAEQEKLSKIRLAKINEITKIWKDLFFILAGEEVFMKIPGVSDYSSFEKSMEQELEEAEQKHLKKGHPVPVGAYIPPPIDLLNQLGELLHLNYIPPQAGKDMAVDLITLKGYYQGVFFSSSIEMVLDLSLCKLIMAISELNAVARQRGITLSPTKARKEKSRSKQTDVFLAFHSLNKKHQTSKSLQSLAANIVQILMYNGKKTPSEKTIIRYLTSDKKIMADLIAMGICKDTTGSVQET